VKKAQQVDRVIRLGDCGFDLRRENPTVRRWIYRLSEKEEAAQYQGL